MGAFFCLMEPMMDQEKILNQLAMNREDPDMPLVHRLLYQLIEEKYRPLLDESSDFMCIVDREGKFVYVNKNLADSLGYMKKELLAMHLRDIVAEENRREFFNYTRQFLKRGRLKIPHMVLSTRFGGSITGEMNSMAFFDNAGKYCGAKAVFTDKTKLIEIERREKKYKSILEDGIGNLDQIIMIVDKDLKVRWVSSTVQKYLGLDKSAVIGEDMRTVFAKKCPGIFREEADFLAHLGEACESPSCEKSFECEIVDPATGGKFCMEHWNYPINQGEMAGGRIVILRDITQRKKSEETLEYYHKKIHAIMEHAVEGIVELRVDNTIEFVNKSFSHKIGYAEIEMLNRPLTEFIVPAERFYLTTIKLIRRSREITFLRKNGTLLYTLTSSIPLVFGTHAPHALCFVADITESKTASLKLRDANMTLRALNDSLVDLSLREGRTGLYNARYLAERLAQEIPRSRRTFRPFALINCDIDFFKSMNDTYGHAFGDAVLEGFAALLKRSVRSTDVIVRTGGDEFVVFLADTEADGALTVARKIIASTKTTALGDKAHRMNVSVSIGIASYPEAGCEEAAALLKAADQAMYRSKSSGRNKITLYQRPAIVDDVSGKTPEGDDLLQGINSRLLSINTHNEEAVLEALRPMVRQLDERLCYPAGTLNKMLKKAEALAMSFSLAPREVRQVRRATYLANIGLLGVPANILSKSGPLNDEEMRCVRNHPLRSASLIREVPFLEALSRDILTHHERFDGEGYPHGLKGEDIPLGGRIIHLVESYAALSLSRPYRPRPLSEEEAIDVVRRESGRQFDPAVVEHFLKLIA